MKRCYRMPLVIFLFLLLIPLSLQAEVEFSFPDAVENEVESLDEKVQSKQNNSGCNVNYGDWLSTVGTMSDLETEILDKNVGDSPSMDVVNNTNFDTEVTPDTILQRCNTRFDDSGDTSYTHWIFCRGFRLPDGKQYSTLQQMKSDVDFADPGHYGLTFYHGGTIDSDGDKWLASFLNEYQNQCRNRETYVTWVGAIVTDGGSRDIVAGSKWHITSTDWKNTIVYDLLTNAQLVVSGHSTINCPLDGSDSVGIYPGGTATTEGKNFTNEFGSKGLWVGDGSTNSDACYSGTASDNPVNANNHGIQIEYKSDPPADKKVTLDAVAKAVSNLY